jgi:hypothetical protein
LLCAVADREHPRIADIRRQFGRFDELVDELKFIHQQLGTNWELLPWDDHRDRRTGRPVPGTGRYLPAASQERLLFKSELDFWNPIFIATDEDEHSTLDQVSALKPAVDWLQIYYLFPVLNHFNEWCASH